LGLPNPLKPLDTSYKFPDESVPVINHWSKGKHGVIGFNLKKAESKNIRVFTVVNEKGECDTENRKLVRG
jgi:hypothetical protein